jgi:hypothetical protein
MADLLEVSNALRGQLGRALEDRAASEARAQELERAAADSDEAYQSERQRRKGAEHETERLRQESARLQRTLRKWEERVVGGVNAPSPLAERVEV